MNTVTLDDFRRSFPHDKMRAVQGGALEFVAKHGEAILEIPTGEGKTAIGMAILRAHARKRMGPLYYVTPTKTQVEQVIAKFPEDAVKILGRAEYPCLYYRDEGKEVTAEDSPCYMLECGHRVDQQTGEVEEEGEEPCPYFQEKFVALRRSKNGAAIVTTTAFFLMNRLMVPGWKDENPAMVVLDEVHRMANVARNIFEVTMTDAHLMRAVDLVKPFDRRAAFQLKTFIRAFRRIARKRPSRTPSLLKRQDLDKLIELLEQIDAKAMEANVRKAVARGEINPRENHAELKLLENLVRKLPRLLRSLEFAVETDKRKALNYVVAFYFKEDDMEIIEGHRRARYHLTLKSYFVAPVIQKAVGDHVVGYSGTIGDEKILGFETRLGQPFATFPSSFDVSKTRVFLPTDTKNLSSKKMRHGDKNKMLRLVAASAKTFAGKGHRSLVVVASEEERRKFLAFADEIKLDTVSYATNGMRAKDAAAAFARGMGDVLVGTSAQYAEGVDLPKGVAPVIFFLRPGYQRPDDPQAQFEAERFSEGHCWALWNWRVMMEALQVRGRNIRTPEDVGVCFFISQQFRRFLFSSLPAWLKPAHNDKMTMDQAVKETIKLLA